METLKLTERGWAGHFICGHRCRFHRNTLIEFGKKKVVVSTVGAMNGYSNEGNENGIDTIGAFGRYYETMAFHSHKSGSYQEADVSRQINFDSEWQISAKSQSKLPADVDNIADKMHDEVVKEISQKLKNGQKL